jgi:hypothetical protein
LLTGCPGTPIKHSLHFQLNAAPLSTRTTAGSAADSVLIQTKPGSEIKKGEV